MRSVIVVFGSATLPDGQPGRSLTARLERTLAEARVDTKSPIVLSGGPVVGPPEAVVMRSWLVERGVAPSRLILEAEALYTLDNAAKVAPLIAGLKATQVKLITSPAHMARSHALLRHELRCVTGRTLPIIKVPSADDASAEEHAREAIKLARDRETQKTKPCRQPPKIVRAQACAGSMRTHKSSQAGA